MQSVCDKPVLNVNGFLVLIALIITAIFTFTSLPKLIASPIITLLTIIIGSGFTILGPNEARVLTFFGKYIGTIKDAGFLWTVPFSTSTLVPLKMINFNTEKLKVNDLNGNPIEVGAVVVWRVKDAAQACFNIDSYKNFIFNQSESVVRTITAKYPYDSADKHSLRGSAEEITKELTKELHEKLAIAGIEVEEVKLSHLAYAPEIASAMLKRQQAVAILEARKYLIENAAVIAEGVIENFAKKGTTNLSDDKKAEIMSNILITLISDKEVNPVIEL
jgi:regulator of protease activity HflC (stomatin/prohibitin superfamily)